MSRVKRKEYFETSISMLDICPSTEAPEADTGVASRARIWPGTLPAHAIRFETSDPSLAPAAASIPANFAHYRMAALTCDCPFMDRSADDWPAKH
jgi:hypothetical protein